MAKASGRSGSGRRAVARQRQRSTKVTRQRSSAPRAKASLPETLAPAAALVLGAGLAMAPEAHAASFAVANTNDSGPGSLRQAIADANALPGADIVTFNAGVTGTVLLTTGQLAISDSLDIQGPGAATLAVSGNDASRVFDVYSGPALIEVGISGLTIEGGAADAGAGVRCRAEDLTLDGVVIKGCAASGAGGGLSANGGTLTIRESEISGNTSEGSGGGAYLRWPNATIESCTISGNSADNYGGGLAARSYDTTVVAHCTVADNSAAAGGGIAVWGSYGFGGARLEHTIVAANSAAADADITTGYADLDVAFSLIEDVGGASINDLGGNLFSQDPQLGPLQDNDGPTRTMAIGASSPAFNAGDPAFVPPPAADQRGGAFARVANGRIDIGAFELQQLGSIPVLGGAGRLLLPGLLGVSGLLLLRRKKLAAPVLVLSLSVAPAAGGEAREVAATGGGDVKAPIARIFQEGEALAIRLADGSNLRVRACELQGAERRGRSGAATAGLVCLEVLAGSGGEASRVTFTVSEQSEQVQ